MEMNRIVEYLKTGLDKYKYVLIICLCGFVLVSLSGNTDTAKENETQTELTADTALLEQRLERSLSQISGVGKAEVILTAKSSSRAVYAYDEDKTVRQSEGDRTADTSQSMAFSGSGSGQLPYSYRRSSRNTGVHWLFAKALHLPLYGWKSQRLWLR